MNIESRRLENCPERELKYVTFAYSSGSINPPVNTVNGEYQVIDESVRRILTAKKQAGLIG